MDLEKFEQLGQKVEALLSRIEELCRKEQELGRLLGDKDEEIRILNERIASFEHERNLVRSKVDDLLGRIDQQLAT